jgi:hypothetical protein
LFNKHGNLKQRKVLINLLSGNAISGVCVHEGRDTIILRGATIHEPDAEPAAADGEILIDRINVDFIQLL